MDYRKAYGLPDRYFLSLGRMVEKKNLATLVAAYAKFCDGWRVASDESARRAPVSLVFVGSGELEGALREQARGLGLRVIDRSDWKAGQSGHGFTRINADGSDRLAADRAGGDASCQVTAEEFVRHQGLEDVQFLGYMESQEEIRAAASCCFGLVCPGTAGLAVTQAQSLGLPFIFCSEEDNGPETEIAKLEFNCLGFELGNEESLAKQVGEMHGQRALWLSRSDEFVRTIAAGYTIDAMVDNFADFFQRRREQQQSRLQAGG